MSQDNLIVLVCKTCDEQNYYTTKNVKKIKVRLELEKFCPKCGKHMTHKEDK